MYENDFIIFDVENGTRFHRLDVISGVVDVWLCLLCIPLWWVYACSYIYFNDDGLPTANYKTYGIIWYTQVLHINTSKFVRQQFGKWLPLFRWLSVCWAQKVFANSCSRKHPKKMSVIARPCLFACQTNKMNYIFIKLTPSKKRGIVRITARAICTLRPKPLKLKFHPKQFACRMSFFFWIRDNPFDMFCTANVRVRV